MADFSIRQFPDAESLRFFMTPELTRSRIKLRFLRQPEETEDHLIELLGALADLLPEMIRSRKAEAHPALGMAYLFAAAKQVLEDLSEETGSCHSEIPIASGMTRLSSVLQNWAAEAIGDGDMFSLSTLSEDARDRTIAYVEPVILACREISLLTRPDKRPDVSMFSLSGLEALRFPRSFISNN